MARALPRPKGVRLSPAAAAALERLVRVRGVYGASLDLSVGVPVIERLRFGGDAQRPTVERVELALAELAESK